ncbi:MAG: 2,3,4,5-tetrahydropyridine-2,6-carboxylate N-succinyltransferase [Rhodobacteraceae bacterium]|nr:2,3,4,5-tetrahydropyridine-2,6-carboxylate N-succinyltransferase [Paracoccaceae bacterium]
MATASELTINTAATALDMANSMFGSGVTVVSATYTGAAIASGIYSDAIATLGSIAPSDVGVILSTGDATSFTNSSGKPNVSSKTTTDNGTAGDSDLTDIAGVSTYDAAVLNAEFIPTGETLTMQLVFSSEEYLEYVNSGVNDSVGIFVNGVKATIAFGDGNISIDNVNNVTTPDLYLSNPISTKHSYSPYNTEMDGLTVTLTIKAPVNPGVVNTLKIGIADDGDALYDCNLLIVADSIQTALIANDDTARLDTGTTQTFDLLANDVSADPMSITITHVNGVPISVGTPVTLAGGESVLLNANGTLTMTTLAGTTSTIFTYTITDSTGSSDTAFVTLTTAPCFVKGTLIDTPNGKVKIEDLSAGDLVLTRDHGEQPLRWIGQTTTKATGKHAPIRFAAGALGNHDEIELSPNHRVLVADFRAELFFGEAEVLVKAKDLVNDLTVRPREDGQDVVYFHLLFDQHEIIVGNGLESESYHPGKETIDSFDAETRAEIFDLMPQLANKIDAYGPTARTVLKSYESKVLLAG